MKHKLITLLIILTVSTLQVSALPFKKAKAAPEVTAAPTVISDSAKVKKDYNTELDEINNYTNSLFTPHVTKVIKLSPENKQRLLKKSLSKAVRHRLSKNFV